MQEYRKILKQLEKTYAPTLLQDYGLVCRQMQYSDEDVALYVAKKHWTNRFDHKRENTIGVFFCVWVSPELLKKREFAYNIHSLKLRSLPGYRLASREFATEFRKLVKSRVTTWPGIRMDYGPLTLLEGRDTCELEDFYNRAEQRILDFVVIHKEIDKLLDASARGLVE